MQPPQVLAEMKKAREIGELERRKLVPWDGKKFGLMVSCFCFRVGYFCLKTQVSCFSYCLFCFFNGWLHFLIH